MMVHAFEALFEMKIPTYMAGFDYIEDAIDLFNKNGAPFTNMKLLCFHIAEKNNVSSAEVKEKISEVIDYSYSKGDKAEAVKYFGLSRRLTLNHLACMYYRLKEEKSARNKDK